MSNRNIIVTGYFGAPIEETARKLAEAEGLAYISLDEEITKRDGRSIKRLVMMNGEHGYRNQEYEVLQELCTGGEDPAVEAETCGEGLAVEAEACGEGPAVEAEACGEGLAVEAEACGEGPAVEAEACGEGPAAGNGTGLVIACGDGVLYDDDSREIAMRQELVIAGEDVGTDELWERAKATEDSYHAFMAFGTEEEKRAAFEQLIKRQADLFAHVREAGA